MLGRPLQAGSTRYITYQLVPEKQCGKRTKIVYRVTVAAAPTSTTTTTTPAP